MKKESFRMIDSYKGKNLIIDRMNFLSLPAQLAYEMIMRWGVVAAEPDGEDSAGRAKLKVMAPKDLVARACETAHLFIEEIEKKEWLIIMPDEMEAELKKSQAEPPRPE